MELNCKSSITLTSSFCAFVDVNSLSAANSVHNGNGGIDVISA